jgi:hypothetical protein
MSRRHHGNRPHRSSGPPGPTDPVRSSFEAPAAADPRERVIRPTPAAEPPPSPTRIDADDHGAERSTAERPIADRPIADRASDHVAPDRLAAEGREPDAMRGPAEPPRMVDAARPPEPARPPAPVRRGPGLDAGPGEMASCTAPQLRRFIKSRPYVPMHELRRRFGINGSEDDVSSIDLGDHHRVFVGLPAREGGLLGELLRGGDIGYELSLDPRTPIVIGLYPMRPVARS